MNSWFWLRLIFHSLKNDHRRSENSLKLDIGQIVLILERKEDNLFKKLYFLRTFCESIPLLSTLHNIHNNLWDITYDYTQAEEKWALQVVKCQPGSCSEGGDSWNQLNLLLMLYRWAVLPEQCWVNIISCDLFFTSQQQQQALGGIYRDLVRKSCIEQLMPFSNRE
jgi:hypothetical protein